MAIFKRKPLKQIPASPPDACDTLNILDVSSNAELFVNTITMFMHNFPEDARHNLNQVLRTKAATITTHITQSRNSLTNDAYHAHLDQAVEAVHATVASLYMARQFNYMREVIYNYFYNEGKQLAHEIKSFAASLEMASS